MELKIKKSNPLKGEINIPGDKSISHRSVIFTSLAEGRSLIRGFLESEDCLNTLRAFQMMGVNIEKIKPGEYIVNGVGLYGLKEPGDVIDCGNSGTGMRLLCGLLAPQPFYSVLTGDNSLRNRPMGRVVNPLRQMGASIWCRDGGYAPLSIKGEKLEGISYTLPVASAQVKSSLLLAGLYSQGDVFLTEPGPSRDHTERMLKGFGVKVYKKGNSIKLPHSEDTKLTPQEVLIPGDISSAAFFIVASLITPGSEILLKNVGLNPTRCGIIDVVRQMGGNLELLNVREVNGEKSADILVKYSELEGVHIDGDIIPRLIDEIPVIAVLASQARGETVIRDAAELKVKETDRIKATVTELGKSGVDIEELPDGMVIKGPCSIIGGVKLESYKDHRIAMSLAVAGLLAEEQITIKNSECINTSFPQFNKLLQKLIQ
ncbi:3-phosphoshikimate 1-carboxyvinyltransferase [Halothermothrix orenii]|uniref:3-phosphoshikimate 1-carboxyvinyltransferase n=1 Tax=Halothermothrix orenii (strain H 168 / OCM 544 / DSM 9562) TaxID=373903 RepID=B8CWX4_HALOH|nr:3-phosphoshikimate 1-carboxyvinyltransferase [Halothermothrix orenii]ACL69793.1 3-phosphoshikimate 1-carboxyvinyltransferase [Halothermothrix orenii H 168]